MLHIIATEAQERRRRGGVIRIIIAIICAIVVFKGLIDGTDSILEAVIAGVCFYILYNIILQAVASI